MVRCKQGPQTHILSVIYPSRGFRNTTLILCTARDIVAKDGLKGLWRGTTPSLIRYVPRVFEQVDFSFIVNHRNVPGVALYMTSLTQLRAVMAKSPHFAPARRYTATQENHSSVLPKLSMQGNLISGATARVTIGFLLNPVSVLKARFEVRSFENL